MREVKEMSAFDIIGPVMIGPSSSHTAGAVFLGQIARKVFGAKPARVEISLHGSFSKTAKGHGTDKALIGGLLGMSAHDERIKNSFEIAKEEGLMYHFKSVDMGDEAHPNSVQFSLLGSGKWAKVTGASLGGGAIEINQVQGRNVKFNGDYSTLLIFGKNQPGTTNDVTGALVENKINIAYMRVERLRHHKEAVMVFETDDPIPERGITAIRALSWVEWVCQIDKIQR